MKRKVSRFFPLFVLLLLGFGAYFFLSALSCQRINCITIKDNNHYKVKSIYEDNKYIFRALYNNGNNLLKIEMRTNSSQDEAQQAIQTQIVRTKGLFEDAAAPYPGEISDVISCSNEYKPVYSAKKQNGINISYFEGYVNDRLVFGSCADDQAKYHDTLAMFYCAKQKKFYQLESIIPRKDYINNRQENDSILNSLGCK
ncbi:MAG: hypothetical protein COX79_02200 [Candidatus Levybacteria bacterium CG_4_10_14_0_2_um_filter_36_16]|nr:MAG: hypothetical protein COX79_02200 [Candidatus Levybacteria bacterium CG_4_10_14_0_2_um_filter_36_16]